MNFHLPKTLTAGGALVLIALIAFFILTKTNDAQTAVPFDQSENRAVSSDDATIERGVQIGTAQGDVSVDQSDGKTINNSTHTENNSHTTNVDKSRKKTTNNFVENNNSFIEHKNVINSSPFEQSKQQFTKPTIQPVDPSISSSQPQAAVQRYVTAAPIDTRPVYERDQNLVAFEKAFQNHGNLGAELAKCSTSNECIYAYYNWQDKALNLLSRADTYLSNNYQKRLHLDQEFSEVDINFPIPDEKQRLQLVRDMFFTRAQTLGGMFALVKYSFLTT